MQRKLILTGLALVTLLGAGCSTPTGTAVQGTTDTYSYSNSETKTPPKETMDTYTYQGALPAEQIEGKQVRITTSKGEIVVALYPDTAPLAVSNFLSLAGNGFYDGVIFHRVIEGFMVQGGDPTGTGRGGPGYRFPDELSDDRTYARGTLAMANSGPDTNGSQFFIMHKDYPLQHDYTIFGQVISGLEVVDAIATTPVDGGDRPVTEVVMQKVVVEDATK